MAKIVPLFYSRGEKGVLKKVKVFYEHVSPWYEVGEDFRSFLPNGVWSSD